MLDPVSSNPIYAIKGAIERDIERRRIGVFGKGEI